MNSSILLRSWSDGLDNIGLLLTNGLLNNRDIPLSWSDGLDNIGLLLTICLLINRDILLSLSDGLDNRLLLTIWLLNNIGLLLLTNCLLTSRNVLHNRCILGNRKFDDHSWRHSDHFMMDRGRSSRVIRRIRVDNECRCDLSKRFLSIFNSPPRLVVIDQEVEVLDDVIAMKTASMPHAERDILTAAFDNPVFHFRSLLSTGHELTQQFHFLFSELLARTELVWCRLFRTNPNYRIISLGSFVLVGMIAKMQGSKVEEAVDLTEDVCGNSGPICRGEDPGSDVVTQITGLLDEELRLC